MGEVLERRQSRLGSAFRGLAHTPKQGLHSGSLHLADAARIAGGTIGDRLFLKSDKDPTLFVDALHRLVPDVPVKVISPGEPLTITP